MLTAMERLESLPPRKRLMRAHQDSVRRIASMRIPLFGLQIGWVGKRETGANELHTGHSDLARAPVAGWIWL